MYISRERESKREEERETGRERERILYVQLSFFLCFCFPNA